MHIGMHGGVLWLERNSRLELRHAGLQNADGGGTRGQGGATDDLAVVGTWCSAADVTQHTIASPRKSGRDEQPADRRRPVTRSQSSKAAGAPSADSQGAAGTASAHKLQIVDARFCIAASAPPAGSPRKCSAPVISVLHTDGAPASPETQVKVIVYPLPSPGRGYLALRCSIPLDGAAAGCATATAEGPGEAALHANACHANAASSGVSSAASTGATSVGNLPHCNSSAQSHLPAVRSALEGVIQRMNHAAYALSALHSDLGARWAHPASKRVGMTIAVLGSAAAAADLDEQLQSDAHNGQPPLAGQRLLRRALRGSALLAEVSRRVAILRKGA